MIDMPYEEVLGAVPFCLDKEAIDWVTNTMGRMSDDENWNSFSAFPYLTSLGKTGETP